MMFFEKQKFGLATREIKIGFEFAVGIIIVLPYSVCFENTFLAGARNELGLKFAVGISPFLIRYVSKNTMLDCWVGNARN